MTPNILDTQLDVLALALGELRIAVAEEIEDEARKLQRVLQRVSRRWAA